MKNFCMFLLLSVIVAGTLWIGTDLEKKAVALSEIQSSLDAIEISIGLLGAAHLEDREKHTGRFIRKVEQDAKNYVDLKRRIDILLKYPIY